MALSQALSTGITGLMTHQTAMDNIGNNLANVNTTGFKQGSYQFSNLLHQSIRGGMAADGTTGRGSVNPISMGMGAQTASINKVFTQGNLENTSNPLDMAINGNGFYVLRQGNGYAYTRAGSFHLGGDNHALLSPEGLYVQGTMAVRQSDGTYKIPSDAKMQDIVIPIGTIGGHSQTTQVEYSGNLNSSQEVSKGLNLFGSTSFPTVDNMQPWMDRDFNGGINTKADETWSVLQDGTYAMSRTAYDAVPDKASLPSNVRVYGDSVLTDFNEPDMRCYWALDLDSVVDGKYELVPLEDPTTGGPVRVDSLDPLRYIPVMQEVNAINGGNVLTSSAFGVMETAIDLVTGEVVETGNMIPASLETDLKDIWYYKGNSWVQPFANIKNGEEIKLSFKKGNSQVEASFTYNEPGPPPAFDEQVAINQEKSNTLEHFLQFLGGDVDDPTAMCQDITPAMFGAVVSEEYPYGNAKTLSPEQESAYKAALANTSLATNDQNRDLVGGVMGLLSLPPKISDSQGGTDAYGTPAESAGVYTREGVSTVDYTRIDPTGETVKSPGPSFNVSLVSNLGSMNALSDLRITYNDVPHESMFTAETEYSEPQGGSSMVTVDYYDSLGNAKSAVVRMSMISQDNDFTTWRWYADCTEDSDFQWQADEFGNINSNLSVGTGLIRFDKEGNYVSGAEYSETSGITIDQRNQGVNNPIWIKVLNGLSSSSKQDLDFSRMTCTAADPDFKLYHQNGKAPGVLKEFAVSQDGVIQGLYDNGNVVDIARIGLAQIPNESGLISAGGNIFYTGPASGTALYGHAGTGGLGAIHQSQLETSNVELSVEFTRLITIERGFQANSRTITTADEMIQELLNLKR